MQDGVHALSNMKYTTNDADFEVEVLAFDESEDIKDINTRIDKINSQLDQLKDEKWKYENHCDKFDYCVAVGSGIIAGIIESIFAGVSHMDDSFKMGSSVVNSSVMKFAHSNGYKGKDLGGAVNFLEKKFPMASDSATETFGGGLNHHLRDYAHHASPLGLLFSLITQFSGCAWGTDVTGKLINVPLTGNPLIGKNFHEKLMFGTSNWFMHLVSDMAGSSTAVSRGNFGTGIPGPLMSLAKSMSSTPFFKKLDANGNKEMSVYLSKLFNGTLTKVDLDGKRYVPFDLRTEIGLGIKHALIIAVNEIVVRTFYFIRRFHMEIKENNVKSFKDFKKIDPMRILPFRNKTIARMLTISLAVIETIDIADAAIRSAVASGGNIYAFLANFIIRINYIGVGRLLIAIGSDMSYAFKGAKIDNKRMNLISEYLFLNDAKVYYKQQEMWKSAYNCGEAIIEAQKIANNSLLFLSDIVADNAKTIDSINENLDKAEANNPGLKNSIKDIMGW